MRGARTLLATLLATAALLVPALAAPDRAAANEPVALATIRLTSFSPSLPERDGTITVSGTVTNTSKKRLVRPRAYFWRNQAPITDAEGFNQALESDSNDPLGARYIADGAIENLYPSDNPYLDPGAMAHFTLKVKVSDLALSPTSGVYLMGVHVLQNDTAPAIGRIRVFVPVLSKEPRNSLQMTSVVALNSRPSLLRRAVGKQPAVFSDDHLANEIKAGGRLDVLLRAADQPDMTFAVDPALVEEIQSIKAGYQVDGSSGTGPGQDDAARWLTLFGRLLEARDGFRLLYGSVDIAALTHSGQLSVLKAAEAAAKTVSLTASLPLLVWPGSGVADAETMSAAASADPAAVLLSDSSTKQGAPLLQGLPADGKPGAPIVNYTSAAFGGGPGPDPSDTPVHLQQRLLAEGWIQASTAPAGTTLGRVRVISTAAQARGDDEAVKAPWIKQTSLSQLLRSAPSAWSAELRYSDNNRAKELSGAQLSDLSGLERSWSTWQELLVDPATARISANQALARSASVRFRRQQAKFDEFVTPQQRTLDGLLNAVQISATRRVLTPKSKVFFPITIRNTLPPSDNADDTTYNAVRVRMDFSSANSQRLTVQPIETTTIAAGQNFQGNAVVEARTNGTVRVTAQLYTASGQAVGRPATIDVRATQAGTVGWLIAIGAGIVLVGTTALRIRQVTRERARAAAAEEVPGSDATRSGPAQDDPPVTSPNQQSSGHERIESIDV